MCLFTCVSVCVAHLDSASPFCLEYTDILILLISWFTLIRIWWFNQKHFHYALGSSFIFTVMRGEMTALLSWKMSVQWQPFCNQACRAEIHSSFPASPSATAEKVWTLAFNVDTLELKIRRVISEVAAEWALDCQVRFERARVAIIRFSDGLLALSS